MSAEAGGESDTPKRRGRIPQSAWPHILERHRSGATLSAIAREFDCTPSAISYIVRKAEAAGVTPADAGGPAPAPAEPTPPPEPEAREAAPVETPADAPPAAPPAEPVAPPERATPRAESAGQRPREAGRQVLRSSGQLRSGGRRESRQETGQEEQREPVEVPAAAEQPQPAERQPTAQTAAAPPSRSEPIDAVEARLRDTARSCLVAYRGWRTQPNETTIQSLSDAMHDLRKALARIEIDISATRRDEQAQRPIPIPAHRAARRPR